MTDNEALEFCESRLYRLEELRKLRKKIERRKDSEENAAAWESVKNEVISICREVEERLLEPDYRSEDVHVALRVCELEFEALEARHSYLPIY